MYQFLSNISSSKIIKKITSINDLTEIVRILNQNEERFWSLFFKQFDHKQEKTSFQCNNNEQTIGFWWALGASNTELIDIFFGTKIRWIRKPDPIKRKKLLCKKTI